MAKKLSRSEIEEIIDGSFPVGYGRQRMGFGRHYRETKNWVFNYQRQYVDWFLRTKTMELKYPQLHCYFTKLVQAEKDTDMKDDRPKKRKDESSAANIVAELLKDDYTNVIVVAVEDLGTDSPTERSCAVLVSAGIGLNDYLMTSRDSVHKVMGFTKEPAECHAIGKLDYAPVLAQDAKRVAMVQQIKKSRADKRAAQARQALLEEFDNVPPSSELGKALGLNG